MQTHNAHQRGAGRPKGRGKKNVVLKFALPCLRAWIFFLRCLLSMFRATGVAWLEEAAWAPQSVPGSPWRRCGTTCLASWRAEGPRLAGVCTPRPGPSARSARGRLGGSVVCTHTWVARLSDVFLGHPCFWPCQRPAICSRPPLRLCSGLVPGGPDPQHLRRQLC